MPTALDLFCGGGGAARGLIAAGFDVVGIDIKDHRKSYPGLFIQGDALRPPVRLEDFDFVWASPPCQAYTVARTRPARRHRKEHPDLVGPTREMLRSGETLYCIENVPGAPLETTSFLCGGQFGLGADCADGRRRWLKRHRLVEANFPTMTHGCRCRGREIIGVYGTGGGASDHGYKGCAREWRQAMEMPDATMAEMAQAVPPAYAEFIGRAAMEHLH